MNTKKRVLVVDDDPAVTDLLQAKLAAHYEVIATNRPTQALGLARTQRPDLIVCDVDMPGMDGGEVCRALTDDATTRDIPFLYLSSIVSPAEVDDLGGLVGGRPGISKRAPVAEIVARIVSMIGT